MSSTDRPLLDHENLDAYRVAVESRALSVQLHEEIPKERRELRLQLERAGMPPPLNIAEGAGKPTGRPATVLARIVVMLAKMWR